ncbi:MAG: ABC transporter ATP-binding protein [Methyloligellaceae bacterium]
MSTITLEKVKKSFGNTEIIHGVDLEIPNGSFTTFVGPSGCGKSTLLRLIAGLDEVTSGQIMLDKNIVNNLSPRERNIAMVFQSYALYPHMTVAENIGFNLRLNKIPKSEIKQRVLESATLLGIDNLLERKPAQLSGGQRQRVAMGRAIIRKPTAFMFDEPLSNLDAKLRVQMRAEIKSLHQKMHTTSIYVTHDQIEAMTLSDKIVVFNHGNIEQIGTPRELYNNPANTFVAGFIGSPSMNLLEATILKEDGHIFVELNSGIRLRTERGENFEDGMKVIAGIRPEHLLLEESVNPFKCNIVDTEYTGAVSHVVCDLSGERLLMALNRKELMAQQLSGEHILSVAPEHVYVFRE